MAGAPRNGTEERLSLGVIRAVAQDHAGYMWIGTEEGLNRYDGYRFTTYKPVPGDPTSISDIFVTAVHEDRGGILWVGTGDGGLNAFDHVTERFTRYQHAASVPSSLPSDRVNQILDDPDGTLWCATIGGLARWNPASRELTTTGLEVLDALAWQPYDAILMDVHMPVMDGLEAMRRIAER